MEQKQGDQITIDLLPTPQGMVDSLLRIYQDSTVSEDRIWARFELIKAMTIAYSHWYGGIRPEYKIEGVD